MTMTNILNTFCLFFAAHASFVLFYINTLRRKCIKEKHKISGEGNVNNYRFHGNIDGLLKLWLLLGVSKGH